MTFWDAAVLGAGATLVYAVIPFVLALVAIVVVVPALLLHHVAVERGWTGDGRRAADDLRKHLTNEWRQWGWITTSGPGSREALRGRLLRRWVNAGRVEQTNQNGYPVVRWAQR